MKRKVLSVMIALGALATAPAAQAASDYFLKIDDIKGEKEAVAPPIEILSWSWGASNPSSVSNSASQGSVQSPRDAASGLATGRRQRAYTPTASQNTQSLRESPSRASTARAASGDIPDLAAAAALGEIQGFSITLDGTSPEAAKLCAQGTHFPKATLTARSEQWDLTDAVVASCTSGPRQSAARDSMPNRISMNVTTPKQTQGATFGERCFSGECPASSITLTLTGQMKHTKTGHVTLLK